MSWRTCATLGVTASLLLAAAPARACNEAGTSLGVSPATARSGDTVTASIPDTDVGAGYTVSVEGRTVAAGTDTVAGDGGVRVTFQMADLGGATRSVHVEVVVAHDSAGHAGFKQSKAITYEVTAMPTAPTSGAATPTAPTSPEQPARQQPTAGKIPAPKPRRPAARRAPARERSAIEPGRRTTRPRSLNAGQGEPRTERLSAPRRFSPAQTHVVAHAAPIAAPADTAREHATTRPTRRGAAGQTAARTALPEHLIDWPPPVATALRATLPRASARARAGAPVDTSRGPSLPALAVSLLVLLLAIGGWTATAIRARRPRPSPPDPDTARLAMIEIELQQMIDEAHPQADGDRPREAPRLRSGV